MATYIIRMAYEHAMSDVIPSLACAGEVPNLPARVTGGCGGLLTDTCDEVDSEYHMGCMFLREWGDLISKEVSSMLLANRINALPSCSSSISKFFNAHQSLSWTDWSE